MFARETDACRLRWCISSSSLKRHHAADRLPAGHRTLHALARPITASRLPMLRCDWYTDITGWGTRLRPAPNRHDQAQRPSARRAAAYATAPYLCSYLPDGSWTQVATPSHLTAAGRKRAGGWGSAERVYYRPYCDHCRECVPVRFPSPIRHGRSQRRSTCRHSKLAALAHFSV
jgi:hypothetical protein